MNKEVSMGVDIGGSHISVALVDANGRLLDGTFYKQKVEVHASGSTIIRQWASALHGKLSPPSGCTLRGIGIAMPGPFDYEQGVAVIEGVNKYQGIFGLNVLAALRSHLELDQRLPVRFENDAACFGLGESLSGVAASYRKIIAVTLGTGFGATFIADHLILKKGKGVPPDGVLYNSKLRNGIAEDYISTRWITAAYERYAGIKGADPRTIAEKATQQDRLACRVYEELGDSIAACLAPWIRAFGAGCIVLGGSISQSWPLFLPALTRRLEKENALVALIPSADMEMSAIAGAAALIGRSSSNAVEAHPASSETRPASPEAWRRSTQPLMPEQARLMPGTPGTYDRYPFRRLGDGHISRGFGTLAQWISRHRTVIIDGYVGNDWTAIRENIRTCLDSMSLRSLWYEAAAFEKSAQEIDALVMPFLGEPGSVWGTKTTLSLRDLFRMDKLAGIDPGTEHDITLIIGTGAALCGWDAPVIYIDLPKNELQYRMRAGSASNLGRRSPAIATEMYKRYYFVDWVLLNAHRQDIKGKITVVADAQWKEDLTWCSREAIDKGLYEAAHNAFRVRPWFEAGAWGGQWLKDHIPSLPQDEVNYAWSFELIAPENGMVFESNGHLLELSFDWLMEHDPIAILGDDAARFGTEFPIRFDFLDTFDGGNLSIQCHPRLPYIKKHFGERITQDEAYYILDCKPGAGVYLGFQDAVDPVAFRHELEYSAENNTAVDIGRFVQKHPARPHELFLIPSGVIHSAGVNNLVLEISATPYIFTFKMYDWLRLDLNGEPRPINIAHAFNNLDFQQKGRRVGEELISRPVLLEKGEGYQLIHLPTHPDHFYDVHRVEFLQEVNLCTEGKCHVLMLVEGESVTVLTKTGEKHRFNYAETFVVPAAAGSYKVINEGSGQARLIKAFVK